MADQTKLTIDIESVLRGLDKTLKGLAAIRKSLESVASVRLNAQSTDKAALATQKLALQQQKLGVQTQELANRQEKARQTTDRLTQSQQRLTIGQQQLAQAQQRVNKAFGQADAHVKFFKSIQQAALDADRHVQFFRNSERNLAKAPQVDAHVRAFRAIQKGSDDADAHVRAFRAHEAALAKAPQLDAHIKAFRALEANTKAASQAVLGLGNSLRSIGQGLATLGVTLTAAVSAPLIAVGTASTSAAVELDSLKRGLTAIVGSADEANRQLARLTQIAKLPGIGFEEAIQGSIRLQAVGFSAAEAERNLRAFSNAVALTGGGRDELNRVTVQLGQLAAKGKVLSQDLRPIIEAAPAVGRALLEAFGTVNAADIQELGLSTKEFLGILVSQLDELPRAAAGAKNSFENFKDEVFRAAAAVGDALLPGLIRLVEVVGPIITNLANAFATLPQPLQVVVIGIGTLLAALGPVVFIIGQLTIGVGRLLVGFVELNAAGIVPGIAAMRAYAVAALDAAAAQRVLSASTVLAGGGLATIVTALVAAIATYAIYNAFQKDALTLSKERASQLTDEIKSLEDQAKFLNGLQSGVQRTADEQQRLSDIYDKLNTQAQIRVAGISDEEKRLLRLRVELERIIQLRGEERIQQAATIAGQIADSATSIAANDRSRQSLTERIAANNALVETLEREGRITLETGRQLERLGQSAGGDVRQAINGLQVESARLVARQKELGDSTAETKTELEGYLEALRALDPRHQLTARQLLILAKNMGVFHGDVEQMVPVLERYIQKTDEASKSTANFNRSLSENERQLNEAGKRADAAAKARQEIIQSAAAVARETHVNFQGALKSLRQMVDAVPELAAAFKRESELTGKSLDDLLRDALETAFKGRAKDKSGTSLRNAQEQLAKALADVALASSDQQVKIKQLENERLLQAAESGQRLQILSYQEFLELRANLTSESLRAEIAQQAKAVATARATQSRLLAAAQKSGIAPAERTKRQAQAAEANEEAVKAETKLLELQAKEALITDTLRQTQLEAQKEQLATVRQLEIEFAQLGSRIEDALQAEVTEEFREALTQLGRAQNFLSEQIEKARKKGNADRVAELTIAAALNQRQIEAIENIQAQKDALGSLAAANELVRRAKERQAQLEADLTFQVEFRGLAEEEAIKQRLAGESKLNDSLVLARDTIQQIIAALQARGVEPPQALIEFIRELNTSVKGLGELPFSEQFRLAEKEFNRINDERIAKIQDVERAVRNRDIAEAEGAILIRRINNQYTADLEAQLVLLKRIAEASGQEGLRKQAANAGEVVKDTRDQVADLGKQINAAGKDAFRSGLTDFFSDILNRTASAKDALLNLLSSVTTAINNVIAENLSKELFESIFGGADKQAGGLIATVKRIFGFGGDKGAGVAADAAKDVTDVADTAAQTAALTAGTTAAVTAFATGVAAATVTFTTGVTASVAAFTSAVIAAGAAFAATITAAAGTGAIGGLGDTLGGAETGMFPAVPGGAIRVVEGGFPEAILTTDPRHATKQVGILREFLARTRGLQGRIPGFAAGGIVSRETAEMNMLGSIQRAASIPLSLPDAALVGGGRSGDLTLRQILVDDQRDISNWYNSAEGDRVQVQWLARNRPRIQKLLGIRER